MSACRDALNALTCVPTIDRDELARLLELLRGVVAGGGDSGHHSSLGELAAALECLATSTHPAAPVVEGEIARHDPEVVLLLPWWAGRFRSRLEAWLEQADLCARVMAVGEAVESAPWGGVVLTASPRCYFTGRWQQGPAAARRAAALLAAPLARVVSIVECPRTTLDRDLSLVDLRPEDWWEGRLHRAPVECTSEVDTDPMSAEASGFIADDVSGSGDFGGTWVRTGGAHNPSAEPGDRSSGVCRLKFVSGGCEHVESGEEVCVYDPVTGRLATKRPWRLQPGDVVVLRNSLAGSPDVRDEAVRILRSESGDDVAQLALAARDELKEAFVNFVARHGLPWLERAIERETRDPGYATYLVHRLPDDDYIAPEKKGAYPALRRALRLPPDDGTRESALRELRAATRHAGSVIFRRLRAGLVTEPRISDLDSKASITIREGDAELTLQVLESCEGPIAGVVEWRPRGGGRH